ncbi:MAG: chloride channel protein [Propionibacteriaceae bacterium]|nr:chloride channel protein [Propionibacteriaceae bacterium]
MTGDEQRAAPSDGFGVIARLSVLAMVVGLLAGAGASAFVAVQHHLTHFLWVGVPEALGLEAAPWWLVLTLPVVGGALTWGAMQLPGHGGHSPLDGLRLDIGPHQVASVLLAALASLSFGAVLGPEAPLVAIGTAVGAAVLRSPQHPARQVMMIVGAMAGAGAVLGNPLVTTILLLELALVGGAQVARPAVLLPSLVGLGSGYLLQVGVGPWTGLGDVQLSIKTLPVYENVRLGDLLFGLVLAVVVALVAFLAQRAAGALARAGRKLPLLLLLAAGLVTGLAAVLVTLVTGQSSTLVVFAGQTSMSAYLALPTLGVAAVVLVGKFVAYVACLGSGFKGGSLFPAIALGTILASMGGLVLGQEAVPALAATAIAAAIAGGMRLPFTGALLGVLLTISAGPAITVPAILGAVVGMLTRLAADQGFAQPEPAVAG